jgi:hypothetical protein
MKPEEITEKISDIVAAVLGLDETDLIPDADFILDFNTSPQDLEKIQAELETAFDISLPVLSEMTSLSLIELTALVEDSIL